MTARLFGQLLDGTAVHEVSLASGDLTVSVLTLGAIIRDVRLAGVGHPLVLGFDNPSDYLTAPYFGAVAGRYANRIAGGRFAIDGVRYQVTQNEKDKTHLHGGKLGFSHRVWMLAADTRDSVTLVLVSRDGEEGYPGEVRASVTYALVEPATIRMEATATTSAPTVVNLAQHSYFNLDDSADILDHRLQIFAAAYTPTDSDLIPTGEILSVAGSNFDFRAPRPIRRMRGSERIAYDKNFVVDRIRAAAPRPHAKLASLKSGVTLTVESTEPGLQFYDGSYIDLATAGLGGRLYGRNAGVCLEPQLFPDSPNHLNFPSPLLRPGETYRQISTFSFERP